MLIRTFILTALLAPATALAQPVHAQSLLCIPEAAAVARETNGSFTAGRLDTQTKFIQSQEDGRWVVRMHPHDVVLFDNCESEFVCEASDGFGGGFSRNSGDQRGSRFTAFWMTGADGVSNANVAKGYCAQI